MNFEGEGMSPCYHKNSGRLPNDAGQLPTGVRDLPITLSESSLAIPLKCCILRIWGKLCCPSE